MSLEHLTFNLDIFDSLPEPVLVRPYVTVDQLLRDTLRVFERELDRYQTYTLTYQGKSLPDRQSFENLRLPREALLTLAYSDPDRAVWSPLMTESAPDDAIAQLVTLNRKQVFTLTTFPARIGRHIAHEPDPPAINLGTLPDGDTVSRRHAILTKTDVEYVIKPLEANNPVFLNEYELPYGSEHILSTGDILRFGLIQMRFEAIRG